MKGKAPRAGGTARSEGTGAGTGQGCRAGEGDRGQEAGRDHTGPTRRVRSMDLKVKARNSYSASVINLYFLRFIQYYGIKYKSNQKL